MKKTLFALSILVSGVSLAAEFPYGATDWTRRNYAETIAVSSFENPEAVPQKSVMPDTDAIATVVSSITTFEAVDADDWDTAITYVQNTPQAGLAIKRTTTENATTYTWMGLTSSGWVALTGATPDDVGTYAVTINVDYSEHKVQYVIGDTQQFTSGWLSLDADVKVLSNVLLYGYGATGEIEAKSAARPLTGTVTDIVDFDMNYENLTVTITVQKDWSALTGVKVVLKDAKGTTVATKNGTLDANGVFVADFKSESGVKSGEAYTCDISFTGSYNGNGLEAASKQNTLVKLYADSQWFGYNGGDALVNANGTAVTIDTENNRISAGDSTKGTITPNPENGEIPDSSQIAMSARVVVDGDDYWAFSELPTKVGAAQFAITMAKTTDNATGWACKVGSDWVAVTPGKEGYVGAGTYDVLVTVDYTKKGGAYWLKKSTDETYFQLATFTLTETQTELNDIALYGGDVSSLIVSRATTGVVDAQIDEGNKTITVNGNSSVNLSGLSKDSSYTVKQASGGNLKWEDSTADGGKYATVANDKLVVHSGTPANGLKSYHSYALGLSPSEKTSVPKAVIDDTALTTESVPVKIMNIPVELPPTGYTVYFQLEQKSVDGAKWSDYGEATPNKNLSIPLDGKLYRVKTILK